MLTLDRWIVSAPDLRRQVDIQTVLVELLEALRAPAGWPGRGVVGPRRHSIQSLKQGMELLIRVITDGTLTSRD